ncbi:uncharacterized protein LOC124259514 isoform X5 [Haliotis rubra]|uniref:uncharacterized protein LOC124259514 isoform X5 n=1 Tax=Haliotis rubra TaxID=36100 RepID=UPI001EE56611|nr:uncharacterized protein LOC124259514 isoform X5 [Haliotis rubra]
MANSYHMEALRKQRLLDRKNEALTRLESQGSDLTREAVMDGYLSKKTPKESVLITDGGQFDQQRNQGVFIHGLERNGIDVSMITVERVLFSPVLGQV